MTKISCGIIIGALILGLGISINRQSVNSKINDEKSEYLSVTNEDGIVLETDDPYFIEKQEGYEYPEPFTITYHSSITNTDRHAMIFLPADFSEDKEYPVLYLLHGLGGSHRTWHNKSADVIMQNMYYFEGVPEMIVVCANSDVNEEEDTEDLPFNEILAAYDLTGKDLVENLMPYINSHYPVKEGRDNTAIAGNSMGGRNTLYTSFTYPELFGYVGAFSSAVVVPDSKYYRMTPILDDLSLPDNIESFNLIMLAVGKSDDVCGDITYKLHDILIDKGIEHIFYDTEGGHQNTVWQNALYNFSKKLFK